jgi:sterol desaturase/sphingolipid hydroxylase (fatty acid hydroxylase superfamily)
MRFACGQISLQGVFVTVSSSIAFAELVGYLLHRLMHSERFPTLSQAHMIHHLLLYGPNQPMRASEYKVATAGRFSLGNIGLEWLLPVSVVLMACWGALRVLGVPRTYELLAMSTLLGWPMFMFSYLHDRMHLQGFWMERAPLVKIWFLKARRLHDIHHRSLNDHGRMDRNFGIGFFFFDRIFRTIGKRHCPFNWLGYRAALRRHNQRADDFFDFPSGYRV